MLREHSVYMEPRPPVFMGSTLPKYMGWSVKGLVVGSRVSGREVIVPRMKLVRVPSVVLETEKSVGKNGSVDVFIGEYTLTIPGPVVIETKLLSLYPGRLFNFTAQQQHEGEPRAQ